MGKREGKDSGSNPDTAKHFFCFLNFVISPWMIRGAGEKEESRTV